ncbi:hypothetical protein ES705_22508 [subsurface metagenome]
MKNKKMAIGIMLLLFAISGICNVTNVSAETSDLPPLSYAYYSFNLNTNDKIDISISSSGVVNIYIMDSLHFQHLIASGGLSWTYFHRWKDVTHLEYTYTIPYDAEYYVVIYNKNVLFGRTVEVDIEVIPYVNIGLISLIAIGVVISSVLVIVLVKRKNKKKREAGIQHQEVIKPKSFYCSNCGAENIDITSDYCSKCGSKIIK